MCYFSDLEFRKNNKGVFKPDEIDRLAKMFFPRTLQIVFGCGAEPTLYKDFPNLIKIAKSYNVPYVGLVSNGQLITEDHLKQLIRYGLDELILSVHGVNQETYENLMTNAKYEKFHALLKNLKAVKLELGASIPKLRLNYTVNSDNLDELSDFFKIYGDYDISTLQIRPIMDLGQAGYRKFELDTYVKQYNDTIDRLSEGCKERGITFLARKSDPNYKTEVEDYSSLIASSVLRYISPQRVWRPDFDWKNEMYDEFCKRINWNESLIKCIFASKDELNQSNDWKQRLTLTYEVT